MSSRCGSDGARPATVLTLLCWWCALAVCTRCHWTAARSSRAPGEMHVSEHPSGHDQRQHQRRRPIRPPPFLEAYRRHRLEHVRRADRLRRAYRRVVLRDQRLGIDPDRPRDAADMAAGVEVTAAPGEIVALDAADDRLPDACALAYLRHGHSGLAASRCQRVTNGHATPPRLLINGCSSIRFEHMTSSPGSPYQGDDDPV